jgi:hypothetical protein
MAGSRVSLCRLQLLACLPGVVAGLVPGLSFTAPFQGLYLAQVSVVGEDAGPLRVSDVDPDSAAARAGFRAGDEILGAGNFDEANAAFNAIQPGERRVFQVQNASESRSVEAVGLTPELAAVWYRTLWHPIAGGLFLALGLLVFATAPLEPPPLWRSIAVGIAGFGLAVGFAIGWVTETVFSRLVLWQRFAMGNGEDWYFGQSLLGLGAGLTLAVLAALETRRRLDSRARLH